MSLAELSMDTAHLNEMCLKIQLPQMETSGSFFLPLILLPGDINRQSISLVGLAGSLEGHS